MNPDKSFRNAYGGLYAIAVLNLIAGAVIMAMGNEAWLGGILLLIGFVFGVLAAIAHYTKMLWPLVIGAVFIVFDLVYTIVESIQAAEAPSLWGTLIKVAIVGYIGQAILERIRARKVEQNLSIQG